MTSHPVLGAAVCKINIIINFNGVAPIPLGRGGGRQGHQRIFHISTSLLRSEVRPSCSCMFRSRNLHVSKTASYFDAPLFPSDAQG